MDKRYQVFVSSTYEDLKNEREAVFQTLMKMDCMPAGMELFPAADEEQLEYIKRVIDDSDYYLLIIGGRYGSTTVDGISYTELEYDYATSKGLKVLAMLHGAPDEIVVGKTDKDSSLTERLNTFRRKAQQNRLVSYWKDQNELRSQVVLGMHNMIRRFPAVGWVRANRVGSEDLLLEINELRKANAELANRVRESEPSTPAALVEIAGLNEKFTLGLTYRDWHATQSRHVKISMTWEQIFSLAAPHLISKLDERSLKEVLEKAIADSMGIDTRTRSISDNDFQTIKVQLLALGLIETDVLPLTNVLQLQLTKAGHALMLSVCSVKTNR